MTLFSYENYFEARNKAIIAMLADCGLQSIEIRGLKNDDVKETTILVNGKGNKQRIVFISPELKRMLIKYCHASSSSSAPNYALKRMLIKYERIKNQCFKNRQIPLPFS